MRKSTVVKRSSSRKPAAIAKRSGRARARITRTVGPRRMASSALSLAEKSVLGTASKVIREYDGLLRRLAQR